LDSQLHLIDAFEAEIEDLDGRIRGLFDADAGYRALLRVAGIAPGVRRDPAGARSVRSPRFPSPRQLNSWAGLTPRHRESDTTVHRGAITKMGCGGRRRRPMCVQR
jgi:transposase